VHGRNVVLAHLRTATREAHQALEGALGLLDPHLTLIAYTRLLRRFYGFWVVWEPQISILLDDDALLRPRRRLHLLAADLKMLGFSNEDLAALPRCPAPDITCRAEAFGALYVMEGSTLGGRVIGRNLERCLGPACQGAATYFNGYGRQTNRMWQEFLVVLNAMPGEDAEAAARGATATFERLGFWLTRELES
jgi:heme oxygenase (biliverdin-IX-beta and delta-forming)